MPQLDRDLQILTVVGARPQFVKAAAVSRAIAAHNHRLSSSPTRRGGQAPGGRYIDERILHTGQHYDPNMSSVFFAELGIPEPAHHLNVGSGSHARQTGDMLIGIERVIQADKPDMVLVYGDTNSTLAGAMAASKLRVPVAHVEAGLRSFNRAMPEEINRILTDSISDLLLCPSQSAVDQLGREGLTRGVHNVGDVMYDSLLHHVKQSEAHSTIMDRLGLVAGSFALATLHRAENTSSPDQLQALLATLAALPLPVVLPMHPRTRAVLGSDWRPAGALKVIAPVGYLDILALIRAARVVLTDSGGMQKEAYWMGRPCVTLREETEWVELVQAGVNRLSGTHRERIAEGFDWALAWQPSGKTGLYGAGDTAGQIVKLLKEFT